MPLNRRLLFWLVVALQLLCLLGFAGSREYALATGRVVVLKTAPVDPRDLFQGDYVRLGYEISSIPGQYDPGETIYVQLAESDGVWRSTGAGDTQSPSGETFIKGRVVWTRGYGSAQPTAMVEYGIEDYFVPEGLGRQIERSGGKLRVKVAIDGSGNAMIEELLPGE